MEIPKAIVYLLESSVCFTLLFGMYLILLKRQGRPNLNRMVLLFFVLISTLIPLITHTHIKEEKRTVPIEQTSGYSVKPQVGAQEVIVDEIDSPVLQPLNNAERSIGTGYILLLVYLAVAGFMLLRFIWSLLVFTIELKRYGRWERISGQKVAVCSRWSQTFSFFNFIVLSEKDFTSPNRDILISHERVHSKQFHSLDLLIAELFMAVHWFNPLVYLLKPSFSEVHEYLADGKIVAKGTDSVFYKHLIIDSISNSIAPKLSNSFSAKTLKNRLNMITINQPKGSSARYFIVLPMIIALMAVFSLKVESRVVYVPEKLSLAPIVEDEIISLPIEDVLEMSENKDYAKGKGLQIGELEAEEDLVLNSELFADVDSTILYKRLEGIIGKDKVRLITIYQTRDSKEIFRSFNIGENTPFYIVSITKNKPQPIIELSDEGTKTIVKPVSIQVNDDYMVYNYLIVERGNYWMNIQNSEIIGDYLYCVAIPKDADGKIDFALNVRDRKIVLKSKERQGVANASIYHSKGDSLAYKAGEKADSLSAKAIKESILVDKDIVQKAMGNWTTMEMRKGYEGEPDYFAVQIKFKSPPVPSSDYVPNLHDMNFSRMGNPDDNWPISYIRENLVYPKSYRPKRNKLNKVEVEFSLSEGGEVSDVKVVKGVSPEVDAELVRVVSTMPGWQPERPMGTATPAVVTLKFMLIRK